MKLSVEEIIELLPSRMNPESDLVIEEEFFLVLQCMELTQLFKPEEPYVYLEFIYNNDIGKWVLSDNVLSTEVYQVPVQNNVIFWNLSDKIKNTNKSK